MNKTVFAGISLFVLLYIFWLLSVFAKPPFPDMHDWVNTDFSNSTVALADMVEGGPGKDGILSIDQPVFVSVGEADKWLHESEPVVVFANGTKSKAYPLQILMYHEIVNDQLGDEKISVTYCPLCNAAMVFSRQHKGELLDFGTTGKVYSSNLVMYDRQSESWWLQFTGESVVGDYAGETLTLLPSKIVAFEDYKNAFPSGKVLSRKTDLNKKYGINPYTHYDSRAVPIAWFFRRPFDDRLPAMERVLGINNNNNAVAFPFSYLNTVPLLQTKLADQDVLVVSKPGMASSVDKRVIRESKDVLAAAAYSRAVAGRTLDFELNDNDIVDIQTRSTWNMFGVAIDGELKGTRLKQLDRGVYFSFVWLDFYPRSEIFKKRL
ncbi:MAG: DUF3179 domain-containing protein [Gammaproteobacteria bacterium]|nr:DUF3179 domain-containing protein [Gammaproteobacteria bacterium]